MIRYLAIGGSKLLSNTSMNLTDTINVAAWAEGNYSMTCNVRDA